MHARTPSPAALVGRERELATLRDLLASAIGGRGVVALIGGEAGIGKTALADALCREATAQGALVLIGRCYDLSETPPYGPWLELFAGYAPADGRPQGSMPTVPPAFARRGGVGAVASQAALLAEVGDFFAALTPRRPVVLLLDDLHWADPASLELLRSLARSVAALPLLILATYRSDELTRRHPLYALLPLLERESRAIRLALKPLADDAIRALVARYALPGADGEALVAYLLVRAEGNAFFTTQVLATLEEEGILRWADGRWAVGDLATASVPVALRQVIDGRVARLDEEAQDALAVAAVIGQEAPFAVWAAVSGMDEEELGEVVAQAAAARLMEETPDGAGARFVHALIREAIYEGILPSRRRRLHRAVGETLAALPNPDADAVAHHFRIIGDARTVGWLVKAGERARDAQAIVTAVARMQEAMALLDGPEYVALAGNLAFQIGYLLRQSDRPQAVQYFAEAIRRAREVDDPAMAGIAQCHLGYVFSYDNQFARAIAELRAGVGVLESLPPGAWERTATLRGSITALGDARALLAWILARAGAYDEALGLLGLTLAAADAALDALDYYSRLTVYQAASGLGHPKVAKRAYAWVRKDLQPLEGSRLLGGTLFGFLVNTVLPYHADDLAYREEIVEAAERAVARAQILQLVNPFPVHALRFPLDFIVGAWDTAEEYAAIAQRWGATMTRTAGRTRATIARLRGRATEAWREVRQWLPDGPTTEPGTQGFLEGLLLVELGSLLALDAGDLDAAQQWAEGYDRWLAWSGAVHGRSEGQALWAHFHRRTGDMDTACAHAERALAHATDPRQPLALLAGHRLLGELDTETGRYEQAERHLEQSLALADACAAPFERALTLLAIATLHAAQGSSEGARAPLDEARATFQRLGTLPALARADTLAERLDTLTRRPPAYPAGLSPREVEVLRLLASGKTNREIGDALYLSENTVRVHVRHIFEKTGTDNRTAAAIFARDHGLA